MTNTVAAVCCWTNIVGHVLVATPVAIEGDYVVFESKSANERTTVTNAYALSVFQERERSRLRKALGVADPPRTAEDANERAFVQRELERIDAMERDKLLPTEEANSRRRALDAFMKRGAIGNNGKKTRRM